MTLADQVGAIRKLAASGLSGMDIAARVGVEPGDVESILHGGWAGMMSDTNPAGGPVSRIIAFPFAHDTPNLHNGVPIYTPKVGDVLLDAWIEVITAWNGTTPFADLGIFTDLPYGWWSNTGSGIDLTVADNVGSLDHAMRSQGVPNNGVASSLSMAVLVAVALSGHWGTAGRVMPATFVRTDPVKVVVSRDGSTAAADAGATQGTATAYLMVATS